MRIEEAIATLKKSAEKKFAQSIDLAVNLQDVDFGKQENRFTEEVILPAGRGKTAKIGVIGNTLVIKAKGLKMKEGELQFIDENRLGEMEREKKVVRSIARKCDFLIAEPQLMLRIGKSLGKLLSPRGKMPKPFPPSSDPKDLIEKLRNTVRMKVQSKTLQCLIGTESMSDDQLLQNFAAVIAALEKRLPKGRGNIKTAYIKKTMSEPIKIDLK